MPNKRRKGEFLEIFTYHIFLGIWWWCWCSTYRLLGVTRTCCCKLHRPNHTQVLMWRDLRNSGMWMGKYNSHCDHQVVLRILTRSDIFCHDTDHFVLKKKTYILSITHRYKLEKAPVTDNISLLYIYYRWLFENCWIWLHVYVISSNFSLMTFLKIGETLAKINKNFLVNRARLKIACVVLRLFLWVRWRPWVFICQIVATGTDDGGSGENMHAILSQP